MGSNPLGRGEQLALTPTHDDGDLVEPQTYMRLTGLARLPDGAASTSGRLGSRRPDQALFDVADPLSPRMVINARCAVLEISARPAPGGRPGSGRSVDDIAIRVVETGYRPASYYAPGELVPASHRLQRETFTDLTVPIVDAEH